MQIVIELSELDYKWITLRKGDETLYPLTLTVYDAIKNGTPFDKVVEDIKADIEKYEADCILSDDSKECKECDKIVFGSIYNIIDKHTKGESK